MNMRKELEKFLLEHGYELTNLTTCEKGAAINIEYKKLDNSASNEFRTVGNNENAQEECVHPFSAIQEISEGQAYCLSCGKFI